MPSVAKAPLDKMAESLELTFQGMFMKEKLIFRINFRYRWQLINTVSDNGLMPRNKQLLSIIAWNIKTASYEIEARTAHS